MTCAKAKSRARFFLKTDESRDFHWLLGLTKEQTVGEVLSKVVKRSFTWTDLLAPGVNVPAEELLARNCQRERKRQFGGAETTVSTPLIPTAMPLYWLDPVAGCS